MLRLVAYSEDGVRRFPLRRDRLVIGRGEECDIRLPYRGVAARHARLTRENGSFAIEDLGSRKGTHVNGVKVKRAVLELLDEIRLGGIVLLLEDASGAAEPPKPAPTPTPRERSVTATGERMLAALAGISDWVLSDAESRTTLESRVDDLLEELGGGVIFLFTGSWDDPTIKFVMASEGEWLTHGEEIFAQVEEEARRHSGGELLGTLGDHEAALSYAAAEALDRQYLLAGAFPGLAAAEVEFSLPKTFRSLLALLVIGLVHHLGRYEPILPGTRGQVDLRLAPGMIVGESAASRELMEALRAAAAAPVNVLLLGEPGSRKDQLAHTLHLSGPRREGPFLGADCRGLSEQQLDAELFGAEVAGSKKAIRREGKISAASGGTLFLDAVSELPLGLQGKLVRFLRKGEVSPRGDGTPREVDVRLICGSDEPLDRLAGRGVLRADLVHLLSAITVAVPPLRMRREDLPLLLQSFINRFCHETGKRVHGITVKAMSALSGYPYPGNLVELENIARQLVYRCVDGQPIDISQLPQEVRLGAIHAAGSVDAESELDISRLVAACEEAAIREALRRTDGNKSGAARLLGLSRNGLAMKMERYQIES